MIALNRDTIWFAIGMIAALVLITSSVMGVSAMVREAWRGKLSAGTVVRGVSAVLGLALTLWALTMAIGL
jgi:hypothetical protein